MSLVAVVVVGGGAFHFKKTYRPGPASAAQRQGEALGGYHSHAEFEKECKHCHAPLHCINPTGCQECHKDVARQRAEASGLHGILPGTNRCQTCHVEHKGRDAVISRFPLANVNHERLTGFSLARHQQGYDGQVLACADCHMEHRFDAGSVDCVACHTGDDAVFVAEHTDTFSGNCLHCHDGRDRMQDFDHDQVFALTEGHELEGCGDCHRGQTFASAPRDCGDCHDEPDVHEGQFGQDCSRCHVTVVWEEGRLTRHTFRLDHGGEELDCEVCHLDTYVEHTCYECHDHQPDEMAELHAKEDIDDFEDCVLCHPTGESGEGREIVKANE